MCVRTKRDLIRIGLNLGIPLLELKGTREEMCTILNKKIGCNRYYFSKSAHGIRQIVNYKILK
jgi:hypothetical protein